MELLMAVHSHQPEGNFDWIFAEAYEKAYLPFLKALNQHPDIKASLHYTGCLLDWFAEKQPQFIKTLRQLVERGQVEMLSGGYYEPILSLIPRRDILGQIRLMNEKVKEFTGYSPCGLWLAERVWEPSLIGPLTEAGIKYTVVDDSHFSSVGKEADEMSGYYVTEDEGRKLFLFPGSEKLRYFMPFKLPHETVNYLKGVKEKGVGAKAFADDGEKFGIWPGTHKWVYEERWLENFLNAIEAERGWLKTATFSEYIKSHEPMGRIYLSCASYREMMEWSGGYFKNFLVKYPEANNMQKKMSYVSERCSKAKSKKATLSLYKGQCNCAYWHGVFGGLYLNHLRKAVYSNLIEAEKVIDGAAHKGSRWVEVEVLDLDADAHDEVLVSTPKLNLYFSPRYGGTLFEMDFKPLSLNLTNTLARRREAYHSKIAQLKKSDVNFNRAADMPASIHEVTGLKSGIEPNDLNYDWYRKACLLDHFLKEGTGPKDFASSKFEPAGDFLDGPYKYELKKSAGEVSLRFTREGNYSPAAGLSHKVGVAKSVKVCGAGGAVELDYELRNLSSAELSLWFGAEFNYSLSDPHLNRVGEVRDLRNINVNDQWYGTRLDFEFSRPTSLWYSPIETISDSESGLERTYQGLSLLFHWKLKLAPGEKWSVKAIKEISAQNRAS